MAKQQKRYIVNMTMRATKLRTHRMAENIGVLNITKPSGVSMQKTQRTGFAGCWNGSNLSVLSWD